MWQQHGTYIRISKRIPSPYQALLQILHKLDVVGRLTKWVVEISGYDIRITLARAIKGQAIAEFIAELAPPPSNSASKETWVIYLDNSSNKSGHRAEVVA